MEESPDRQATAPTPGLRGRLAALWGDAPLRRAVWSGVAAYAVLQVAFCAWVHHCFEGHYYGPFLTARLFGVPQAEAAYGIRAVEPGSGWDGQFYYHVANDLTLRRGAARHMDNPSYRYQRAGVPLLAKMAGRALGYKVTPPPLYHGLQLALTAFGFGVLVYWLGRNNLSAWYALAWLGAGGTVTSLFHGLPDAPSDAFFAAACCALFTRHLGTYAVAATLMALCREGFIVFPAAVAALTALNLLRWPGGGPYGRRVLLTALPGAVVLGWAAYVAHRLDLPLLYGSRMAPWGSLVDWPFAGFWYHLRLGWEAGQSAEVRYKLLSCLTLATVMLLALRHARRSAVFVCVWPFLLLSSMTGYTIWVHSPGWDFFTGHLKNTGPILVVGLLLLPFERGAWLRFVLALNLAVGLEIHFLAKVWRPPLFSPELAAVATPPLLTPGPVMPLVEDFRCRVERVPPVTDREPYNGFWKFLHRAARIGRWRVTNLSQAAWLPTPRSGPYAVNFGYKLLNESGTLVAEGRVPLGGPVAPGEAVEFAVPLRPDLPRGRYTFRVSMLQEGYRWFNGVDPSYGMSEEWSVE